MDQPTGTRRKAGALDRYGRLIGPGAGVLLGAATAFFLAAMPPRILLRLIDMTGLPAGVANGQGLLALGLAVVVGVATWALFLLLDRKPAPRPRPLAIGHVAAPVLRRADAHPDAPACRPIFAGSDLGPPLDQADWRIMAGEGFTPLDTLELTEVVTDHAPSPAIPPVEIATPEQAGNETIPIEEARPAEAAETTPDTGGAAAPPPAVVRDDPADGASAPVTVGEETASGPDAEAAVAPAPPETPSPSPEEAPAPADPAPKGDASPLAAGMARLETALARKGLDGNAVNVTPLRREIRPVDGSLRDAITAIEQRIGGR